MRNNLRGTYHTDEESSVDENGGRWCKKVKHTAIISQHTCEGFQSISYLSLSYTNVLLQYLYMRQWQTCIVNSTDVVRKNETKSNLASAHPSELKGKGERKLKTQKNQVVIGSVQVFAKKLVQNWIFLVNVILVIRS